LQGKFRIISIDLVDLLWLGVCVVGWSGVNRNRKWVFSYVMQRLVPTHTGGWVIGLLFFDSVLKIVY